MKYEQKVIIETSEYICRVKWIDGVVAQKTLESELIRCRDCIDYSKEDKICFSIGCNCNENDYCSWAEKKEE